MMMLLLVLVSYINRLSLSIEANFIYKFYLILVILLGLYQRYYGLFSGFDFEPLDWNLIIRRFNVQYDVIGICDSELESN